MHNLEIFFEMDILRKLIFMIMSRYSHNIVTSDMNIEVPHFQVTLYIVFDPFFLIAIVRPKS